MSILIKGMEMPKPKLEDMATIYDAYVLVSPNGHAVIVVDSEDGLDSTEYPLVSVPPHGRLIDADAFEQKNAYFWGKDFIGAKYEDCLCDLINAAPTVIEADKDINVLCKEEETKEI